MGFSYCNTLEEHARNPHSCGGIVWTDELAAEAAFKALLAFYDKFPVFSSHRHDLYLVGESYAGIYIPTLARQIVRYNTNQTNTSRILPLVGFAVGDGCLGTNTGICNVLNPDNPYAFDVWNIVFLAGHGQIPMSTFREVMHACHHSHNNNDNGKSGHPSETHTVDWATLFLRGTELSSNELVDQNNADCRAALKRVDEQVGGVYAYGYVLRVTPFVCR